MSFWVIAMRNVGEGLKESPVFVSMLMVWSVWESVGGRALRGWWRMVGVGPWWSQFEL